MKLFACCISSTTVDAHETPKSNEAIKVPLKRKRKKVIPKTLKRQVWETHIGREKGTGLCFCCKRQTIQQIEFHCGHYISEANGGQTTLENLRPICAQCNLSMGSKNMDEFMKKHGF